MSRLLSAAVELHGVAKGDGSLHLTREPDGVETLCKRTLAPNRWCQLHWSSPDEAAAAVALVLRLGWAPLGGACRSCMRELGLGVAS